MSKRSITVELDSTTIGALAVLGNPVDVLVRLADSAVNVVRRPTHDERTRTDMSLRFERKKADDTIVEAAETAATTLRVARRRADAVVQAARDVADVVPPRRATLADTDSDRARADERVQEERRAADAVVEGERARDSRSLRVLGERAATDRDLGGERDQLDDMIVHQREANQQMVQATLRAQDLADVAQIATERAVASERALVEAAEFREMFLGIVGHDLRTPLGAMLMGAEALLSGSRLEEQDTRIIERMIRSGQRMRTMITQLLDLTRARLGGGLPIECEPADLGELCQQVVDEFGVPIQLTTEGDLTGCWDQGRLTEVLANLVSNATQHAARGTSVVVNVYAADAEVVVEVTNQGAPIPAELLPWIFDPFRGSGRHSSSSSSGLGLGLGLYIASQIVRMHGGTLDVRSADSTTTFAMRLPRNNPESA